MINLVECKNNEFNVKTLIEKYCKDLRDKQLIHMPLKWKVFYSRVKIKRFYPLQKKAMQLRLWLKLPTSHGDQKHDHLGNLCDSNWSISLNGNNV